LRFETCATRLYDENRDSYEMPKYFTHTTKIQLFEQPHGLYDIVYVCKSIFINCEIQFFLSNFNFEN